MVTASSTGPSNPAGHPSYRASPQVCPLLSPVQASKNSGAAGSIQEEPGYLHHLGIIQPLAEDLLYQLEDLLQNHHHL